METEALMDAPQESAGSPEASQPQSVSEQFRSALASYEADLQCRERRVIIKEVVLDVMTTMLIKVQTILNTVQSVDELVDVLYARLTRELSEQEYGDKEKIVEWTRVAIGNMCSHASNNSN